MGIYPWPTFLCIVHGLAAEKREVESKGKQELCRFSLKKSDKSVTFPNQETGVENEHLYRVKR